MGGLQVGSGSAAKKSVDASIPLVPFIDLLLCCVMFLLVTAVWNQLASHDVVQNLPGERAVDETAKDRLDLVLRIGAEGYELSSTAGDRFPIPNVAGAYDGQALQARLGMYRQSLPHERAITVVADDGVIYDAVVQAMDAAAAEGFVGFAVTGS
jgi:biopolymer transport protein ExbD